MAPTEILAEQHFMTFQALLAPLGIPVTLLTSSLPARARAEGRAAAASGESGCVVGTHALVQEGVVFRRLGLAIVDEQHRFGVEQRARLKALGAQPDVLVMTATPIPRSLALTLFGDLDVTELDELPPGREPITTQLITPAEAHRRDSLYRFVREEVRAGRRAYVVCPLIEEGELDATDVVAHHAHLATEVFPDLDLTFVESQRRLGGGNILDVRFRDANGTHWLIELKRSRITLPAIDQLDIVINELQRASFASFTAPRE